MELWVAIGLLLCTGSVLVQGQLLQDVRAYWNGEEITGPILIYHDEISVDPGTPGDASTYTLGTFQDTGGNLFCVGTGRPRVSWRIADGNFRNDVNLDGESPSSLSGYQIVRNGELAVPSFARLTRSSSSTNPTASNVNGLWTCRAGAEPELSDLQVVLDNFVFAGLYRRNHATLGGVIIFNIIAVDSSLTSYTGNPPIFTLFGDTENGPPVTYFWTRDGAEVPQNSSFRVSIIVNAEGLTDIPNSVNRAAYSQSKYRSTLTVSGYFPGVYQYSVNNRAMSSALLSNTFTIEGGGSVGELTATQDALNRVRVSWTAPSSPPPRGYRLRVVSEGINIIVPGTSRILIIEEFGVHIIQVEPRSAHYPSVAMTREVTVRGIREPAITVSSLTATTVTISIVAEQFSLDVNEYRLSVTRVTGANTDDMLCSDADVRQETFTVTAPSDPATTMLSNLQEFSTYRVSVVTVFNAFGTPMPETTSGMDFTTLSTAPNGRPQNLQVMVTSRRIVAIWEPINCIERNGQITGYEVSCREEGEMPSDLNFTTSLTFTCEGLTPGRTYIFRVAGVNTNGNGPPLEQTRTTDEEPPGPVSGFSAVPMFTSIFLSWGRPENPNGEIIGYEFTYRIGNGDIATENTTDLATNFTIQSLSPSTTVSNLSVTAYTRAGRGETRTLGDVVTPAEPTLPVVMNVRVESLSASSVRVTWDRITTVQEITSYTVYYSSVQGRKRQSGNEGSMTVAASENSADITGLLENVQYQFQVVAMATFGGRNITGERSVVDSNSMFTIMGPGGGGNNGGGDGPPVGAIIGGIILAVAIVVGIVFLILLILLIRRRRKSSMIPRPKNAEAIRYTKTGLALTDIEKNIEPSIDDFPTDTQAIEGESVVFKVVVSGKPLPTLAWYHDDIEIVNNYAQEVLDDGSLNLPSVECKQAGVYTFVAANSGGRVEQQVKLSVQFEGEKTPEVERKSMTLEAVPVPKFGEYVVMNHNSNNQGFRDQFLALESGDDYPKTVGLSADFKKLNRFANITNYDHNQIILKPMEGYEECEREFINGCYIDGYSLPKKFIATQGPIPRTTIDFWRLVWQEKPTTIVMVTHLKEGNKKKCEQYWPETGSSTYGPFKVTLTEQQTFADYTVRIMQVSAQGSNRPMKLQQFHFTAWPDHGVPDYATPMLAFHRRIKSTHNPKRGPMLVHCSAGVGRTGTFICIDSVLEQIKKEQVVDIAGVINKMRHQRMKMVQTPEQYIFLHDAMLESVTCGDTQISASDLRLRMKKYERVDPNTGVNTFQSQFDVLQQVSPKVSEVLCKSALENPDRNRRTEYLPSDRFRVLLKGEHPDYINAVFAHGYKHQKAYMIAEGPMASTARNVLKILYDRKVGAVVMLSALIENGEETSVQYWPLTGQLGKFGEYTVDLLSEEALEGFIIRKLSILEQKSQKAHQVIQFHIQCWAPGGQCSNLKAVVDSIDELAKIQRRTGNRPIFVHCSDTVTRCGMFCAMATVIDRCKTEGVVDVFQVVKALRVQKPGAVPTLDNYKTIFDCLLVFLDSFDTYANFS